MYDPKTLNALHVRVQNEGASSDQEIVPIKLFHE